MGKKRIHELAKELSLTSADLIQKIIDWKLMPGHKLVASSGLEDYMAEEISRRLNSPGGGDPSSTPQVVRRRKKVAAGAEDAVSSDSTQVAEEAEAQEHAEPVETKPEPAPKALEVTVRPPKSESATIIATLSPSQFKDSQVKKNVPATAEKNQVVPDFKKLVPTPVQSSEPPQSVSLPSREEKAAEPSQAVISEKVEVKAAPTAEKATPGAAAAEAAPAPEAPAPVAPRKITRELGDTPAKIISPPKNFDAAKVIGSKPNWKDSQGGGGRPGGGPGGGAPRRPAGDGRPPREGGGGDWQNRRGTTTEPGRGGAPARTPDFRRTEPQAAPPPEADTSRRRDKKKKGPGGGTRFDSDDGANKSRRRDVVERTDLYSEGDWERVRRRGKNAKKGLKAKAEASVPKAIKRRIKVDEAITVSELAHRLSIKAGDIIKKLMSMGVLANLNQSLDFDTATIVASEFGYEVEKSAFDEENILQLEYADSSPEETRPPVVTIMGHVDHGKTSLLDYIRKTNIQSGEAGGITQHIGAYHVRAGGRNITFLDTPGHEAFTSMRSRGAQVTDIVILIVAADDGLMPQTREAADHAKAAEVPIIVAINKIDKPAADPERVRREMMEIGLVAEAWGGDTVFVEISAKTGQGVDELLDMILLQADILDLKARPDGAAKGRIIEARLDKGRGPVATVLVQDGMLKQGDTYVCGVFYGRIRAMLDDQGQRVAEAGPAIPVEVQGISGVPQAGDEFIVLEDEKQARQVSQHRLLRQRESELTKTSKLTLENLFDNIKAGAVKALNLIIKTDVQGSLEAIVDAVLKLSTSEMKINVIHQSTGAVSETDILLASASNALVICFGVRPPTKVQELADAEHIQIRYYDVIYKLIDDIKEAMAGLLDPVKSEKVLGRAEVRATFAVSKVGTIAGSYVLDGKIVRGSRARLLRDSVVVHDGKLSSLKRMKDDVREVLSGYECGIGFENYNDLKVGDHIEAYQVEETAATVDLIDEALARAAAKDKADKDKADKEKAEIERAEGGE
ncbi:translation initiation factor IF-2 [Deltaproteobacteria bacterium Smac51]|nr:translation initiation factor IF-2 [Deltaproteobacteria bacterium Smac51]